MEIPRLITKYPKNSVCDRCTIPIRLSTWKGVKVVYKTGKGRYYGFLCAHCVTRTHSHNAKPRVTIQDLDDYVSRKLYPKIRSYHN